MCTKGSCGNYDNNDYVWLNVENNGRMSISSGKHTAERIKDEVSGTALCMTTEKR